MPRTYRVVWMGSNTVVADAINLEDCTYNENVTNARWLQTTLARLLHFEIKEVRAFAGFSTRYELTLSPLMRSHYYNLTKSKEVNQTLFNIRRAWMFLLDNKDTPIVVTRYATPDISQR